MLVVCGLAACTTPPAHDPRPKLIAATSDVADLRSFVAAQRAKATAQRATLVVYVGASWCEPCQRFHDALKAGELDASLSNLHFLEFDHDRAKGALAAAGYTSRMIPLFALPNPDGTASGQQIEGSIKGPTAVSQNLLPRLRELLAGSSTQPSPVH